MGRHDEWKATQEIKCMLKAYQREGTFNEAALNACNHEVSMTHLVNVYPTAPAKEHSDLPAWVEMDSYSGFERVCEPENAPVLPRSTPTSPHGLRWTAILDLSVCASLRTHLSSQHSTVKLLPLSLSHHAPTMYPLKLQVDTRCTVDN